jgi:hypothetical protein
MTLEEILPALKDGKTISRMELVDDPIYIRIQFKIEKESLFGRTSFFTNKQQIDKDEDWHPYRSIKVKDIFSDNWEIVQ